MNWGERLHIWRRHLRPRGSLDRDALRIVSQIVVATAVTLLVMRTFGLPNLTWAVVVAVLSVQQDADASVSSGIGYILGAIMGSALGVLAVTVVGGSDLVVVRLAVTIAVAGAIIVLWPTLQYLAVTAAVVALYSSPESADALSLAGAVIIGTLAGVAASATIMPKSSARSVHYLAERCLRDCRRLLDLTLAAIDHESRRERDEAHAALFDHMQDARQMLARSFRTPRLPVGTPLRDVLAAIERLWGALVILDRVFRDEVPNLPADGLHRLKPQLAQIQHTACQVVDELLDQADNRRETPTMGALTAQLAEVRRLERSIPAHERGQALHALFFALDEVDRNLSELGDLLAGSE